MACFVCFAMHGLCHCVPLRLSVLLCPPTLHPKRCPGPNGVLLLPARFLFCCVIPSLSSCTDNHDACATTVRVCPLLPCIPCADDHDACATAMRVCPLLPCIRRAGRGPFIKVLGRSWTRQCVEDRHFAVSAFLITPVENYDAQASVSAPLNISCQQEPIKVLGTP